MHALQALLDHLPRIAAALHEFPDHLQVHVFDALMQVILDEARRGVEPAGVYGGAHYDPSQTAVMDAVRYDTTNRGR